MSEGSVYTGALRAEFNFILPGRCREGKQHRGRKNNKSKGMTLYLASVLKNKSRVVHMGRYTWECVVELESRKEMWFQV